MIHRSPILIKVGLWFCLAPKFLHAVLIHHMGSFLKKVDSLQTWNSVNYWGKALFVLVLVFPFITNLFSCVLMLQVVHPVLPFFSIKSFPTKMSLSILPDSRLIRQSKSSSFPLS